MINQIKKLIARLLIMDFECEDIYKYQAKIRLVMKI